MTLPPWQEDVVAAGELYLVGGAVRDELLGLPESIDDERDYLVRAMPPEELERILARHGKVALVGKSFGVYKFYEPTSERPYDLAFPRREYSTGVGHRDFDVAWDPDMPVADDLARRDFTINAMARRVGADEIIDPCGGRDDLSRKLVRMIFDTAFEEDPLRVLRGVRFAARFGFEVHPGTHDRMVESVELLRTLSAERVQEELSKIMSQCERPSDAFRMMHEIGALAVVLPELDRGAGVEQNEYHPDDVFIHSLKSCDAAPREDLLVRWAALLHDVGKVDNKQVIKEDGAERVVFYGHEDASAEHTARIMSRLRFPRAFSDQCVAIVQHHMFSYAPDWKDATVRRFMRRVGLNNLEPLFRLREADCRSRDLVEEIENLEELRARVETEIDAGRTLKVEDLAIDGRDVMKHASVSAGPEVGKILSALLEAVTDDPSLNEREALLRLVEEMKGG